MANIVEKKELANYLAEARSWETTRIKQLESSTIKAWWAAAAFAIIAALAVGTVAVLGPQKTSVPYVIRVDNNTGATDVVQALKNGDTNYDEVINKYNVQWYVRWREGYSKNTLDQAYKTVGLMSSPDEQAKYGEYMAKSNPNSPINTNAEIEVKIKSTKFNNEKLAVVRFSKAYRGGKPTHWNAFVTFTYAGTPMAESDRDLNPLGFQVTEYRVDRDEAVVQDENLPAQPANSVVTPYTNLPAPAPAPVPVPATGVSSANTLPQVPPIH